MGTTRIVFLVVLLFAAQAAIADDRHNIVGPGAASCEAMLNKVAEAPVAQMLFVAWAQGYLSGLNMVRLGNQQPAAAISDANSLFESISGYCKNNPRDSVTDATSSLYTALLAGPAERQQSMNSQRSNSSTPMTSQPARDAPSDSPD